VITDVGQNNQVSSVKEVKDLVSSAKSEGRKSVLLLVRKEGQPRFVVLKFE
jgi:serine protease Do